MKRRIKNTHLNAALLKYTFEHRNEKWFFRFYRHVPRLNTADPRNSRASKLFYLFRVGVLMSLCFSWADDYRDQTRWDDLISWFYIAIDLMNPNESAEENPLPWTRSRQLKHKRVSFLFDLQNDALVIWKKFRCLSVPLNKLFRVIKKFPKTICSSNERSSPFFVLLKRFILVLSQKILDWGTKLVDELFVV